MRLVEYLNSMLSTTPPPPIVPTWPFRKGDNTTASLRSSVAVIIATFKGSAATRAISSIIVADPQFGLHQQLL